MKRIYFVGILAIASALLINMAMAGDVEIALEAELADEILAPMVIAVPADVGDHDGIEPNEPSNGKFVWAPGAPVIGGPNGNKGSVKFIINLPEEDTYAVWAWVVAWDGNSDSFFVTWEPADPKENPQQTGNNDFRWSIGNGNSWHWDRVEAWKADDTHTDREWELPAGETILTIWTREDATMLDCLFITSDIVGGQANARLPTDEDRQLQIEGVNQAVEAAGKLPTTWGRIRSRY